MFKNKTAFISGANRGIGKSICIKFLENGANIICATRKLDKRLENLFKKKKKYKNQKIYFIIIDLNDEENIKKEIKDKNLQKKQIDFLINNAATSHGSIFEMTKISTIRQIFETNFFSHLTLIQLLIRSLRKSSFPSIINIGSISGLIPERGNIAYGTSKSALMFASKILANELSHYNIRVNSIAPSIIDTGMSSLMDEVSKNRINNLSYNKNIIPAEQVAEMVLFLCSKNSKFINGSTLRIDGGMKT